MDGNLDLPGLAVEEGCAAMPACGADSETVTRVDVADAGVESAVEAVCTTGVEADSVAYVSDWP